MTEKLVRSLTGLSGFLMKCNNDIISVNSYPCLPPIKHSLSFQYLGEHFSEDVESVSEDEEENIARIANAVQCHI